jgi:hypothetical protein
MKMQIKRMIKKINALKIFDTLKMGVEEVDIVFLSSDADKGLEIGGLFYAQIIDPLMDYCRREKIKYICISIPFSSLRKSSTYSKSHTINWAYLLMRRRVWKWIFEKKIKTKIIAGVGLTTDLNIVAINNNITTYELMHGFGLGKNDYIWGSESRKYKKEILPNTFIAYDRQTYETLSNILKDRSSHVKLARHHFYDRDEYSDLKTIEDLEIRFSKKELQNGKLSILITLQHGYDGSVDELRNILNNGLIHDELINCVKSHCDINWIIKLHPVQLRSDKYGWIRDRLEIIFNGRQNVFIDEYSNCDTYAILHFVNGHITMSSGTVVEAAMLGVPSLGLCPTLRNGGIMSDAFIYEEIHDLFERGSLNSDCINSYISKLIKFKDEGKVVPRMYSKDMPSAAALMLKRILD